ncbi:MAG: cyclodeaminase/cyclohydrolase family protein [Peptoniphilaceae bacterium]|uniref:cyclodeaminase/cyclohydrolase family protein n=1 Tax=Parvimonas sp. TaxID=1944660 RepID=UPI0025D393B7|nr:cyclodeaminase/cyclohydrolase family protein [Parvimonas sp.]MCI5997557.1 cyclodeaminase/cyclohydrolase family protein [Parvimonas sp.]MDD7765152.1 cyclodeaminase/cyclohydrolase family protein [Peptoniphilaceae bacterium]MDY3051231.1 cyclodeaminase/cyclohydrolase family protein [Parvimonas sp.]
MEQKMCDKTINLFLQELKDKQPVPGGGGASALVGAVGVALLNMDAVYTTGNEKYKDVEEEINAQIAKYNVLIEDLKELVQADADAFYPLSKCYKMPKNTEEEKKLKREALEENLYKAAMVPLTIMEKSYEAILLIDRLTEIGNKNVIGDVATGAVFLEAALKGASLSVFANTSSMKNEENIKLINEKSMKLLKEGTELANKSFEKIFNSFLK